MAKEIVGNESLDPLLIEMWAANAMLSQRNWNPAEKLPYIQYALAIEQRPLLLREAFATYMALNQFSRACQTGKLIAAQHWPEDRQNLAAYAAACQSKPIHSFSLGK
jgi:hypothetical protein